MSLLVITPTQRPLLQRLLDGVHDLWLDQRAGRSALRTLDGRTLADIGVHASEIDSIEAESHGRVAQSRLRIVAGAHHA